MINTDANPYTGDNPVHWNRNMGSELQSNLSGAGSFITTGATLFGMANAGAVVDGHLDANGNFSQRVNGANVVTTCLTAAAGASSAVSAFSQIAGPYGAVVGAALGVVGTAVTGGMNAHNTQKTIAALKVIDAEAVPMNNDDMLTVRLVIQFCLEKMQTKFYKSAATAAVVGQPLVPLYKLAVAVKKTATHTKGLDRAHNARKLVALSKKQGKAGDLARRVIGALLAKDFERVMEDTVADAMKSG